MADWDGCRGNGVQPGCRMATPNTSITLVRSLGRQDPEDRVPSEVYLGSRGAGMAGWDSSTKPLNPALSCGTLTTSSGSIPPERAQAASRREA